MFNRDDAYGNFTIGTKLISLFTSFISPLCHLLPLLSIVKCYCNETETRDYELISGTVRVWWRATRLEMYIILTSLTAVLSQHISHVERINHVRIKKKRRNSYEDESRSLITSRKG